ncbi:hypothetical protein [Microbacterium sp. A1-JK]|uniref:hypothetical protein n=1 Tax=Microbacterium sp. A1-JK TaxID=3177516 RepID=UPI00388619EE
MPTPTQHGTAVDTFLTRASNTQLTPPLDDEYIAAEIHAQLSTAAGTGTAYTTADDLLTQAETKPVGLRRRTLQLAHLHALRAAR